MPADRVVGEQLDDRVGDVVGVGRRPPLVADDAERLAGGGGALGGRRGSGSGSRVPGAPNSQAVRAIPSWRAGRRA